MEEPKRDYQATILIVSTMAAAIPRWIPALMLSEGLEIPAQLLRMWPVTSFVLNGYMALTEALALGYLFNKLKIARDQEAKILAALSAVVMVTFTIVLAPFIVASTTKQLIAEILNISFVWIWAISVSLSTMVTAAALGYAQRITEQKDGSIDHQEIIYGIIEEIRAAESAYEAKLLADKALGDESGISIPEIIKIRSKNDG